jgi:hypothetical protein
MFKCVHLLLSREVLESERGHFGLMGASLSLCYV